MLKNRIKRFLFAILAVIICLTGCSGTVSHSGYESILPADAQSSSLEAKPFDSNPSSKLDEQTNTKEQTVLITKQEKNIIVPAVSI